MAASALISGYTDAHASCERMLATWKGTEAAVLLPSGYQANHAAVQALAEEVLADGSSLIRGDDSAAAARHAAEHGWIAKDAMPAVHEEKKADQGETGTKVDAPGVEEDPQAPTLIVE